MPDAARILRVPVAVLRTGVGGRIEDQRRRFPFGEFATTTGSEPFRQTQISKLDLQLFNLTVKLNTRE